MEFINWDLAKHPLNWVIIFLMLFLFLLAAHLVISFVTRPVNGSPAAQVNAPY